MKPLIALTLFFILATTACSNSNLTVTSEVMVTRTPLPTSTSEPSPTATSTSTPEPTSTPHVAKEFPVCWVEQWRDCPLPVEDLFSVENGGTGEYLKWLKTLSKPFDPAKIKILPMVELGDGKVVYDVSNAPNYEDPETRPFRRNVTSAITTIDGFDYMVLPVEYPDPTDPGNQNKNIWVLGIYPMNGLGAHLGEPPPMGAEARIFDTWLNYMSIAPLVNGTSFNTGTVPLVDEFCDMVGFSEMRERFERFKSGDTTALNGMIVLISMARSADHWYE